jgi:hypothetical protein
MSRMRGKIVNISVENQNPKKNFFLNKKPTKQIASDES